MAKVAQSESMKLLQQAFSVLNLETVTAQVETLSPTAKARNALELLVNSSQDNIADVLPENMRDFATDLFDWARKGSEQSKVTRPLIRAITEVLTTEGKYPQAVEGIAFAVAAAPLLDPDSLTTLVKASVTVETAYAPERYTLQLSTLMEQAFSRYPVPRRLRMLLTMWEEQHDGRWWDMTAGGERAAEPEAPTRYTQKQMVDLFLKSELPCDVHTVQQFRKVRKNDDIVFFLNDYLDKFNDGVLVHPDVSVLASNLDWLPVNVRPETPSTTLLRALVKWRGLLSEVDAERSAWPAKPAKFSDLFPAVRLVDGNTFPLPLEAFRLDGYPLGTTGLSLRLVQNAPMLDANRTYMGNCTWSYKGQMEKGSYALFQILRPGSSEPLYNAAVTHSAQGWRMGEINSRFNAGQVPDAVRSAFREVPKILGDPITEEALEGAKTRTRAVRKNKGILPVGYRL